ncbi:MAG: hypothetical protein A3G75_06350 [Verrucomicrobia bacterium RIFCSPLOWO2_12_FULL_64_8]|nr:MAG: hypothetical protein A3G75_06350 [Verrucomicrobia bacterium RIFCSPLOWO2_12_FULL_64_8]
MRSFSHPFGRRSISAFVPVLLWCAGCATGGMFDPVPATASASGDEKVAIVSVESDPPGATIFVNGAPAGRAPCTIRLAVNSAGDLESYVDITADFSSSYLGQTSGERVSLSFPSAERAPTVVRFTPSEEESYGR